jgi:hypothetical protein
VTFVIVSQLILPRTVFRLHTDDNNLYCRWMNWHVGSVIQRQGLACPERTSYFLKCNLSPQFRKAYCLCLQNRKVLLRLKAEGKKFPWNFSVCLLQYRVLESWTSTSNFTSRINVKSNRHLRLCSRLLTSWNATDIVIFWRAIWAGAVMSSDLELNELDLLPARDSFFFLLFPFQTTQANARNAQVSPWLLAQNEFFALILNSATRMPRTLQSSWRYGQRCFIKSGSHLLRFYITGSRWIKYGYEVLVEW